MTRFFTSLSTFFDIYGDMFVSSIQKHLFYVLVSVSIGFVLGLFFGILLSRAPQLSAITLPLISVFQTIPGIVFIGILFLYTGMEPITVLIALSICAATNPIAEKAMDMLVRLRGCEAHASCILPENDLAVMRKLGMNYTCEPEFGSKDLYGF